MANPTFRLRQTKDGTWECWTKSLPRCTAREDTPQDAIARMQLALEDYELFKSHLKGQCEPAACRYCLESEVPTRGIWNTAETGE